jgi:hypothetical protein
MNKADLIVATLKAAGIERADGGTAVVDRSFQ